ncbi:hypothetical protein N7379_05980 [Rhizobium pusense]|uniref:hypothetical protein n=1 Tax=Agrobacterium pusense TaxID=648995 RepID=UPI002449C651|nr:hypothetical protein [Agrobacterium pusense]MDH0114020.1 hypothetical protein [Agrobacterium pusense]
MSVPLNRQKNIADVAPRVRNHLGLGSASVEDATAFATAAQGEKADSAAQEGTIGSFALIKNRADRIWDVKDFSGSSFRSRIENALNEAASSNLLIRVPAGDGNANVIDAPVTINSGATFKAGLLGDGMSASKIWCDGVGITMEGTAGSFFNLKDIAFRSLQAGVGTALALNWQAPTTGKGFTIDNVSFGPENASSTQWFDICLSIANKGSGHIYGCWFQGKSDTDPKGTGIKLSSANDVIVQATHMYNLEYGARSDGATSLEGFRFLNGIMVRVGHGLWFKSSPTGLPHIEVALSHLNTCYEGIHIEGYSQVNIVDNLLYARNDITVGADQTDIYLDTCPSATVARNKFYSGMPKATYNKTGIKILGSMRNSIIRDNLASERDVFLDMYDTGILGAQGIQDVVVAKNRSERDTAGNPTVTKMYQITDSALHRRITWEGYRDEFRTDATISAALSLTSNTWTTIPFVPLTATHPDLALKATATAGELEVPAGVTYAVISARARISTASGDAQILGLRIMKDSGSGFSEVYRSSSGGADAEIKLATGPSELAFVKGDKIRVEAYQNGAGTGSVSASTVWTSLSFVPQ